MNLLSDPESAAVIAMIGVFEWPKGAADGTALAATPETAIGIVGQGPTAIALGAVTIHPSAAVAASDTNYATISVYKRTNANPGTPVLIASGSTSLTVNNPTGSWTAWQAVALTVVPGAQVAPLDAITVVITKTGSGVVTPQLYLAGFTKVS